MLIFHKRVCGSPARKSNKGYMRGVGKTQKSEDSRHLEPTRHQQQPIMFGGSMCQKVPSKCNKISQTRDTESIPFRVWTGSRFCSSVTGPEGSISILHKCFSNVFHMGIFE
ncbi:hypothetical protein TNCV_2672721 [Trichonephila clavipes]|nr:hypothetical protein TNCV_2672721 [Trichonephila clavipes]